MARVVPWDLWLGDVSGALFETRNLHAVNKFENLLVRQLTDAGRWKFGQVRVPNFQSAYHKPISNLWPACCRQVLPLNDIGGAGGEWICDGSEIHQVLEGEGCLP